MLDYFRQKIIDKQTRPLKIKTNNKFASNRFSHLNFKYKTYGKKNPNLFFYIIRRTPGGGFFSNLNFVIHNLLICEKLKMIPIIDMENYKTIYNCKKKINKSFNAWDYFFYKISKYSLKEVYQSKNIIICDNRTSLNETSSQSHSTKFKFFNSFNFLTKKHYRIFKKYVRIKKSLLIEADKFVKKNFKGKKVLGIHYRGTDMKKAPYHPYPPTDKQMLKITKNLLEKYKFDKIYLCTEDINNLEFYKKNFNKILTFSNNPRVGDKKDLFDSDDDMHRYKIGKGNIIDMLILSKTDHLLYSFSNIPEAAIFYSNKKKFPTTIIDNGLSRGLFLSQFSFNLKKNLPSFLGGFK